MLIQGRNGGSVTFICDLKSDAKEVYLAGDFNHWDPKDDRMLKARDGSFRIKITVPPGEHQYKYIVDGIWFNDPDVEQQVTDSFGTSNSYFCVA